MSEANVNKKTKGSRKVRTGYVVSDKMQKTIVVELEDRKQHALYGKTIRTNSKVKVHDENEIAGVGDLVRIEETRPLSKDKHYPHSPPAIIVGGVCAACFTTAQAGEILVQLTCGGVVIIRLFRPVTG